jgi:hypothetical protein
MPERLPIYDLEHDIVTSLKATKRLVLQAPTGSGKSTQVPQMLLKFGLFDSGQCAILQPRRFGAANNRVMLHGAVSEIDEAGGKKLKTQHGSERLIQAG